MSAVGVVLPTVQVLETNLVNNLKVIRQVTDLGLKEAKELVDNPGQPVKKGVSKDEAEEVKKKLEEAGAKVEMK
ncbi:MAG: ribosomal protein L7/L12 [Candidatus Eisenbacteria sp.]|nr:ribosomal protein L7/L12 [Candidatus Eisenbacteria bacterium]